MNIKYDLVMYLLVKGWPLFCYQEMMLQLALKKVNDIYVGR